MLFVKTAGPEKLHQRIYDSIRESILAGELAPGTRLPSSRSMAREAGVSRNSVLAAYEQLIAEGYLTSHRGSGTYVSSALPEEMLSVGGGGARERRIREDSPPLSDDGRRAMQAGVFPLPENLSRRGELRYDFRYGQPDVAAFPHDAWRKSVTRQLRLVSRKSMQYGQPEGYLPLREALAGYLRRYRAVDGAADRIVVVNGSQQGLDLTARLLLNPGDRLVIEEPHYLGALQVFLARGAKLIPSPVDAEGMDASRLPKAAAEARMAYVTPSHQFPAGAIMSLGRRLSLLDWAERTGAFVVEDDYDSEFRYEGRPIESIQGLDRAGRVIYMGTLSKVMFPALRVGYLVLPETLVEPFCAAKWLADRQTPMMEQEALADFITSGEFERHLRRSRERNADRRAALLEALWDEMGDRIEVSGENAGVHLLVRFPGMDWKTLDALIERAEAEGIGIYSAQRYYLKPPSDAALLFGFASLKAEEIHAGIQRLGRMMK